VVKKGLSEYRGM